jgi:hypothetical protein
MTITVKAIAIYIYIYIYLYIYRYLGDIFGKASKSFCISIVVFLDPLSPTASTSSAVKTPVNTEGDPEPADEVQ